MPVFNAAMQQTHDIDMIRQEAQLLQRQRASNVALSYGAKGTHKRLSIMHSFSATSTNIATNNIPLKTIFFGQYVCSRQFRSIFNHFNVMGPKATESVK